MPITGPSISETLDNDSNATTGQATATSYSPGTSRSRNSVDPNAPGSPAGTPPLGALLGSPAEIPA